ncbi:potassium channel family protein [Occallatibacter riparius]|uniref:Potassium channel family protein n=1 Tax=Occallatibacter riparius TaxID=1002689 RepID=A0A9J7BPY5_9BACT|nr:potassium channel family protein [Occallatibacter riparius]UWZ84843.1 potassium channel family protein [Occallatibacter riparius]
MTQDQHSSLFRKFFGPAGILNRERRSKLLLASIVLFYILPALSENRLIGKIAIIIVLYVALVASAMELAEKRTIFWTAIPLALLSMISLALSQSLPYQWLDLASRIALAIFFFFVSVSLFVYLGRAGGTEKGGMYVSVSLYFLLGMCWFAIYGVLNIVQPGSFTQGGAPMPEPVPWSTFLYFSMTTLTTLGYGDIVAVKPAARMCTTLEAAAGVLYVAITVARLVASRQEQKE